MKREIKRIDAWSAVRVGFFFGLVTGFILGLLNSAIIKYLASTLGAQMLPPDMMNMVNLSAGAIIALSIVMALIMSLTFAISGGIAAVIYNIIASLFGGLEFTVPDSEQTHASPSNASSQDREDAPED